jgi:hypothetical protein
MGKLLDKYNITGVRDFEGSRCSLTALNITHWYSTLLKNILCTFPGPAKLSHINMCADGRKGSTSVTKDTVAGLHDVS